MPRSRPAEPGNRLAILAREPVPGRAKTRLAPSLGAAGAARVYQGFVLDTLDLARRSKVPATVFVSGGRLDSLREFAPPGTSWAAQGAGDLGARMRRAFARLFAAGASRVVMLGTDSPGLPLSRVSAAFRALRRADAVVGPATDGGYYLVGMARPLPALLRGMPWSQGSLMDATRSRALELGLTLAELPPWFDVDNPADLELFAAMAALGRLRPLPRHTLARLADLGGATKARRASKARRH